LKKLVSLAFLVLFLFNVGGYYLVFVGLNLSANQALIAKINNDDYNEQETYLFKIPVTLPYPINPSYERATGEFEHNGEFYRLVKQKFENDTIHIVCVKDDQKKHLKRVMLDFSKKSNEIPTTSNTGSNLLSKLYHDFRINEIIQIIEGNSDYTVTLYAEVSFLLLKRNLSVESPPPKA
jgi:hypothetical protein